MVTSLQRESQLSASFVKNLKAVFPNVDVLRLQTNKCVLRSGLPDLMCIGPWGVHFIECKRIGIPWKTTQGMARLDEANLIAALEKKALGELSMLQRQTLTRWVRILPIRPCPSTACWLLVWWLGTSLLGPMSWFKLEKDKEGGLIAVYDEGHMCTGQTAVNIPTSWWISASELDNYVGGII